MENKNYGEIFCQATEILAQHLIEQISFDRTILCTIVDDSEKNIGKYRVSNTDMTFDAYTSDTNYKINDNVYVSIPGGDWNEQKLIVSKKTNDSETMVEYINPYDRFINITNNIIPTNSLTAGLVANDINKKQILLWSYNSNEDSILKSGGEVYAGYTRLALSGSFQTLLKSFDVRFGDYGLNLVIKTVAVDSDETAIKVCNLSCADMTGNPYNYQGFFPQAKIFDISNINQVIEMELWFYQKAGSFKNGQGAAIPYENMPSNILVKDINVALGYDTQSFDKDTLILYTQDLTDYDVKKDDESNHKKLEVRWIHKFDENGKIKVVELNDGIDYNLTFYRHTLGEPSHSVWSGVDWAFLSSQTVIEGEVSYDCADAAKDPSYNTVWLKPDYNKAQERIKAILTYNNNEEVLFSSILTINNANEVISQETINAVSALNINCEDNSNGNYFLYRLDGRILDHAYSQIKRAFKLYFNTYGDTSGSLTEAESIEWIIPANNTMINLYPEQGQVLDIDGFYHVIKTNEDIEKDTDLSVFNLYYTINSSHRQQNNNNTVKCIVVRNQIEYTAIKELTFGTAGTAGTDYTFVLDFVDNRENALTIGSNNAVLVRARLYDYTGKELDIKGREIEWNLKNNNYIKTIQVENETDKIELQFGVENLKQVPDDNYTILEAILKDWGDYKLKAYLPIPIRLSYEYQFISGATTIVYNSLGYLEDSFRNPYVIYKNNGSESINGVWSIMSATGNNDPYLPKIINQEGKYTLRPVNTYAENSMSELCITGKIEDVVVWSQPIYVYQNKYPTSIINDWNGELTIDENNNAILASKVIAGKKNDDNTFSGVMMGSWGNKDDVESGIKENTGIYGFQYGKASFGFRDDGTAFIGQAGKGRLEFNGENSVIQSSLMDDSNVGMKMDFDDGYIQLAQYNSEEDNQIWIDAQKESIYPIRVGKRYGEKFKVAWDGTVYASDGQFSGNIEANSGKIGDWKIAGTDQELITKDDDINTVGALYTGKSYFFPDGRIRIGDLDEPKFEVKPDGTLHAKEGEFSGSVKGEGFSFGDGAGYKYNYYTMKDGKEVYDGRYFISKEYLEMKDWNIALSTKENEPLEEIKDRINNDNLIDFTGDGKLNMVQGSDGEYNTQIFSLYSEILPMTLKCKYGQVLIQSVNSWVSLFAGKAWDKGRIEINNDGEINLISKNGINGLVVIDTDELNIKNSIVYFGEGKGYVYTKEDNSSYAVLKNTMVDANSQGYLENYTEIDLNKKGQLKIMEGNDGTNTTLMLGLSSDILPLALKTKPQILIQSLNSWVGLCTKNWKNGRIVLDKNNTLELISENLIISSPQLFIGNENNSSVLHIYEDTNTQFDGKVTIFGEIIAEKSITANEGITISSGGLSVTGSASISNGLTVSGGKINFSGVTASDQTGIYARFA